MGNENKKYSIEEVFQMIGEDNLKTECYNNSNKSAENQLTVDGYQVYTRSLRYMTFYQKGTKCVCCGKEGVYFQLDPDRNGANADTRRHFNLYAEDGTLMTKDHIVPKSRGGRDHISNMQTMCVDCNKAKGNRMEGDEEPENTIVAIKTDNKDKTKEFIDENAAIFWILNDIMHVTQHPSKKNPMGYKIKKSIEVTRTFLNCLNSGMPYVGYYWYTKENEPT